MEGMNRRGFIGAIAAALASPLAAKIPVPLPAVSLRTLRRFEAGSVVTRLDVLYGVGALAPEYACRISEGEIETSGWVSGPQLQPGDTFTVAGVFA